MIFGHFSHHYHRNCHNHHHIYHFNHCYHHLYFPSHASKKRQQSSQSNLVPRVSLYGINISTCVSSNWSHIVCSTTSVFVNVILWQAFSTILVIQTRQWRHWRHTLRYMQDKFSYSWICASPIFSDIWDAMCPLSNVPVKALKRHNTLTRVWISNINSNSIVHNFDQDHRSIEVNRQDKIIIDYYNLTPRIGNSSSSCCSVTKKPRRQYLDNGFFNFWISVFLEFLAISREREELLGIRWWQKVRNF